MVFVRTSDRSHIRFCAKKLNSDKRHAIFRHTYILVLVPFLVWRGKGKLEQFRAFFAAGPRPCSPCRLVVRDQSRPWLLYLLCRDLVMLCGLTCFYLFRRYQVRVKLQGLFCDVDEFDRTSKPVVVFRISVWRSLIFPTTNAHIMAYLEYFEG